MASAKHEIESIDYRKRLLGDAPDRLALPTDRPRLASQTMGCAVQWFVLPKALSAALQALSDQLGVSLCITVLAAFKVLLSRYTGQDDIVVGMPIANRHLPEAKGRIGCLDHVLILRTSLAGNPKFSELVTRVRATVEAAYDHQDAPFEKLVEELQPERDLSRNPLFQVMFIFENATTVQQRYSPMGPSSELVDVDGGITKFDLTLGMGDTGTTLEGEFEYNADLFDAETIERMAGHWQVLLEGIAANPDARLSDLPLLTPAEREQVVVEWNATAAPYPHDRCLHELFEAQVEQTPEAVAIVFEDEHITYRTLDQRADRLASYLQTQGVEPEVLVGVCMERTPEMVAALLAVLKAGGAYVPLDPTYPQARLALILQDTEAMVVLSQRHLLERLPTSQASIVCLDRDWPIKISNHGSRRFSGVQPENLGYAIYTSGSTGRPKGVVITHRSAVVFIHWAQTVFERELFSGVLASTSICFDLSIFELFVPLSCGGTVILAETALQLPDLLAGEAVRLVNTVPSAARALLQQGKLPGSVRVVNLAGEPLSTQLVWALYQTPGIERVYDLYGPSEDTTYSTYALRQGVGPATIGRPIANTQVYLLDKQLRPVPVGVAGELYIGGLTPCHFRG